MACINRSDNDDGGYRVLIDQLMLTSRGQRDGVAVIACNDAMKLKAVHNKYGDLLL